MSMKNILFTIIAIILTTSCIEKNGYFNYEEKTIISLICDTTWATNICKTEDRTGQTIYNFNKNGTYKRTNIITDKNEKKAEYNGYWSFYNPSLKVIYLGNRHFWEIEKLKKSFLFL